MDQQLVLLLPPPGRPGRPKRAETRVVEAAMDVMATVSRQIRRRRAYRNEVRRAVRQSEMREIEAALGGVFRAVRRLTVLVEGE